jgi:hypothetical protein
VSTQHEEFPELADESKAALKAAHETHIVNVLYDNVHARRYCAALLREAMKQTLAQAQAANLLSPEGRDVVCAFLMSLRGES